MKKNAKLRCVLAASLACAVLAGCGSKQADVAHVPETGGGMGDQEISLAPETKETEAEPVQEETPAEGGVGQLLPPSQEEKEKNDEIFLGTPDTKEENAPVDLKAELMSASGAQESDLLLFHQEDYDGDGTEEAFAMIGQPDEDYGDDFIIGSIWFVSREGCKKLRETEAMGFSNAAQIMTLGSRKYVLFKEYYATSAVTFVWYVENGKLFEAPFSLKGEVLAELDGDNLFRIMDSSYDCSYDPDIDAVLGHSWKHYYFFCDPETDEVFEYGGTAIDQATAAKLCGRDIVKELLPKGDTLTGLFCRGNGLVVMNFEHEDNGTIDYHHYIYDMNAGGLVDDTREAAGEEPLDGTCLQALIPEMASYPEIEGADGSVLEGGIG